MGDLLLPSKVQMARYRCIFRCRMVFPASMTAGL